MAENWPNCADQRPKRKNNRHVWRRNRPISPEGQAKAGVDRSLDGDDGRRLTNGGKGGWLKEQHLFEGPNLGGEPEGHGWRARLSWARLGRVDLERAGGQTEIVISLGQADLLGQPFRRLNQGVDPPT